jgi:hypothetical protein
MIKNKRTEEKVMENIGINRPRARQRFGEIVSFKDK